MKKVVAIHASLLLSSCGPAEVREIAAVPDLVLHAERFGARGLSAPALRRDGGFAVTARGERRILRFRSDGALVDSIDASVGVERVGWMTWLGDTLRILDAGGSRIAYFGPTGALVRTLNYSRRLTDSLGQPLPLASVSVYALAPDGTALSTALWDGRVPRPAWHPVDDDRRPYYRVWRDGRIAGAIAWMPPFEARRCLVEWELGPYSGVVRHPFCASDLWDVARDGGRFLIARQTNAVGPDADYELVLLGARGDTLVHRRYAYHPVPVPPTVLDSAVARERRSASHLPPSYPAAVVEVAVGAAQRIRADSVLAPLAEVRLGADDTIWLREHRYDGRSRWTILDGRGEPLGRIELPRDHYWGAASREALWAYALDGAAMARLIRYPLPLGRRTDD